MISRLLTWDPPRETRLWGHTRSCRQWACRRQECPYCPGQRMSLADDRRSR
jgi:hypothetical protein